jgi:hypothetical protein
MQLRDILVVKITSRWKPLFALAASLVTDGAAALDQRDSTRAAVTPS